MRLYGDGWYSEQKAAQSVAAFLESRGAKLVGLVISGDGAGWGVLYWSDVVLFENHDFNRRDPSHPFKSVLTQR